MANDGITVIDGAVGTGRNNDVMAKALASVGAADSLQVLQTQEAARLAAAHQTDIALSRAATSSAAAIANPATEIAEATIARVRASSAREGAAPAPVPQAETQTTVVSSGRATGPAAITTEGNVGDGAVIEIVGKRLPPKTLASDLPMVPEPVAPLDRTPMASAVDVAFPAMPRTSFAKLKEPEKEPSSMRRSWIDVASSVFGLQSPNMRNGPIQQIVTQATYLTTGRDYQGKPRAPSGPGNGP